jgi:hypothetical protein
MLTASADVRVYKVFVISGSFLVNPLDNVIVIVESVMMTVNNDRVMFSLPSRMVTPISAVSEVFTTIG